MLKRVSEGEILPAWFYGWAGYDALSRRAIFLPIPLNYLYRWARRLRWAWDDFRATPPRYLLIKRSDIDALQRAAYDKGRYDAKTERYDRILAPLLRMGNHANSK